MPFGFRGRSNSDAKQNTGRRRPSILQRPQSTYVHRSHADEAAAAYHKAAAIYDAEEREIMRSELEKRNRNDQECRRHMDMIARKMRTERQNLDDQLAHTFRVAKANYRAGKITSRELERTQQKVKQQADAEWASLVKWQKSEQTKAQKIFFARGEEIAESTGAALRKARVKKERAQKIVVY